jgi:hypothetical protein
MNLLQDLLGLFRRKSFVRPKGKDFIPVAIDRTDAFGGQIDKTEIKLVRVSELASVIGGGSHYTDADVASYLNTNLNTSIIPDTNDAYDIGSAEFKIRDLYVSDSTIYVGDSYIKSEGEKILVPEIQTGDLHLTNMARSANSVDGTRGSWTFQEGDENLYLINNSSGKRYKFNLTEV